MGAGGQLLPINRVVFKFLTGLPSNFGIFEIFGGCILKFLSFHTRKFSDFMILLKTNCRIPSG